jgi:hypothetical protein
MEIESKFTDMVYKGYILSWWNKQCAFQITLPLK